MSRLQGKPYAQKVVESLDATERANLLGLLNGSSVVPAFRSLTNATAYITDADEGVSHVSLETADGNLTGYLAYTDSYVTLFAYERNSQGIAQYEIDLDAMTISEVQENLDIEGLRTIVTDSLKADLVGGKVPAEQLPSYVDDVVEYEDLAHFPAEGEYGKIYIALDTGSTYRWGGTEYVQIGGSSATPMISITWSELKTLRDGGNLLPGQQYRITDYTFTTIDTNTSSAGHAFDIIVTAEDESHLEEEAFATHHAGDTYFANNKLEAWRIWYSLDNDTNRFDWADSTNGKGVIYRMIDEFNNDLPYDFKNCLIKVSSDYYYTFSRNVASNATDASLVLDSGNKVYDNVMGEYINIGNAKHHLNRNYFFSVGNSLMAYENTFGNDCRLNKFGTGCVLNKFGDGCYDHTFGQNCEGNIFGNGCYNNSIGGGSSKNHFENECYNNTFGINCSYNTLGTVFSSNTFGNSCSYNTFGSVCSSNSLQANCSYNTIGKNCQNIIIYSGSNDNLIGSFCEAINFGTNCSHNSIGENCKSIGFGSYNNFNNIGKKVTYVTFGNSTSNKINYVRYLNVDSGVQFAYIYSADDANASDGNQLQNVHVHSGIIGTDSSNRVSIVVPERGQAYSYDYYATNSVDVMI